MSTIARTALRLVAPLALALSVACATTPTRTSSSASLDDAKKALDDARAHRAATCASEILVAADLLFVQATVLHKQKKYDRVVTKTKEIQRLVQQAKKASPPGCDEKIAKKPPPPPPPDIKPDMGDANADAASRGIDSATERLLRNATIYFSYNEASIREDSKAVLTNIADAMMKNASMRIEVEGHCDARGSTEYNLHLGQRRAWAVKKYLTAQGVKDTQVETISYGEERPVDLGYTEDAHQRNRRAELKPL